MQEWLYRASTAKAGSAETWDLVKRYGFLHRGAFNKASSPQRIANVANVAAGDIIHLYYLGATKGNGRVLGIFRVVDPNDHPDAALFAAAVPETALYTIASGELREKLQKYGYDLDPKLGEFCGWPVVRETEREAQRDSPAYTSTLFPGQNSLILRPPPR